MGYGLDKDRWRALVNVVMSVSQSVSQSVDPRFLKKLYTPVLLLCCNALKIA